MNDRSWMYDQWHKQPRIGLKDEYINGLDIFLEFASRNARTPGVIRCPCTKCKNKRFKKIDEVKFELLKWGYMPRYYVWTSHGEERVIEPPNVHEPTTSYNQLDRGVNTFVDMVHDAAGPWFNVHGSESIEPEEPNNKAKEFFKLLEAAKKPLWPGSEDSVLSLTTKLLDMKSKHNATQKLFNNTLEIFLPNLPDNHNVPKNFYEAKKLVRNLGLPHERIDVCANGCMLFWKEDLQLRECKFCQHPRYKGKARSTSRRGHDVPFKRLHYLPLIPRLQRLFASETTAKYMTWHAERSSEEGKMAHPCRDMFMLRLLPVAFRDVLPENVWSAITELSIFFKDLTSSNLVVENIKKIDEQMPLLLCNLEQLFPPAFFDIMEHLPIHMAHEALMGGPVQYRWMFPFERYLFHLKQKVKNKNRVEGSIINDYLVEETATFCSYYFKKDSAESDSQQPPPVRPYRKRSKQRFMEQIEYKAAHLFVLLNTEILQQYQEKFWEDMEAQQRLIDNSSKNEILESEYASWFTTYVQDPENGITDAYIRDISFGPTRVVTSYDECNTNGFVFHTLDHSSHKSTYNYGVLVKGSHVDGHELDYYGRLLEVIELTYHGSSNATFVLFKCEWFDPVNAVRKHRKFNCLVDVKLARKWRRNNKEPFVFPEQVCPVYYCPYPSIRRVRDDWQAVIPIKARGQIDMDIVDMPYQEDTSEIDPILINTDETLK